MGELKNKKYIKIRCMSNKTIVEIKIDDIKGYLDLDTEEVFIYHLKYKNICMAIKNVHSDLQNHKLEIKVFDDLITSLQF